MVVLLEAVEVLPLDVSSMLPPVQFTVHLLQPTAMDLSVATEAVDTVVEMEGQVEEF